MLKQAVASLALVLAPILALAAAAPVLAQGAKPQKIGAYSGWEAYSFTEGKAKTCYLVGRPKSSEPKSVKRGEAYVTVTHRPGAKVRDEVSVHVGYPLKAGSNVETVVGGAKFSLFTKDEAAWAVDAQTDKSLVDAMAKGPTFMVKATSTRGIDTVDSYAMAGFAQARKAIDGACPP